jgi:8-oxo-dGTP diphosphatase
VAAMTDRFVVVPAAYVFFLRDASEGSGGPEVLLQLRKGTGYMDGYWAAAAAGHVEKGESVFAAAAREAVEEVGVRDVELTPLCAMHRTGATGLPIDERVDYFFAATSWSGEPRILEPDKCADLRWCRLHDLPAPVVPHELKVLEAIRAGDVPPILTHGF